MNISFAKFVEAVKTVRNENEILFSMDEQYQLIFDEKTSLLHVMSKANGKKCLVPINNVMYMNEKPVASLSPKKPTDAPAK